MQVVFLIIVLAIVASVWGHFNKPEVESPIAPTNISQTRQAPQKTVSITPSQTEEPSESSAFSLETFIKYGPLEKEVISDTTQVIFDYSGKVTPEDTPGRISYETKLEGYDKEWQPTNSTERIINLPAGVKDYVFLVRAKIGSIADQTPAAVHFTLKVSPFFGKLKISGVTAPTFSTPSLITLYSRLGNNEKIDITGWKIAGKNGTTTIPQGIEKYDSMNPTKKEGVFLKPSDKIIISSNSSPILDVNFRPNKCLGYLDDGFRHFTIPISKNCPRPVANRLPRYLSSACQLYINSRSQCESMNGNKLKSFGVEGDSACIAYIQATFTYPACFVEYSQDSNFTINEWHIYTNRFQFQREILAEKHDTVYLLDGDNLIIDKFLY
ncbi:MAG: triple tyrosine motif-containing protein [bacterium]